MVAPGKLLEGGGFSVRGDTVDAEVAFVGVASHFGNEGEVVEVVDVLLHEGVEVLDGVCGDVATVVIAVGHEDDPPGFDL